MGLIDMAICAIRCQFFLRGICWWGILRLKTSPTQHTTHNTLNPFRDQINPFRTLTLKPSSKWILGLGFIWFGWISYDLGKVWVLVEIIWGFRLRFRWYRAQLDAFRLPRWILELTRHLLMVGPTSGRLHLPHFNLQCMVLPP